MLYLFMQERESSKLKFFSTESKPDTIDFIFKSPSVCLSVSAYVLVRILPNLLVCLCVCTSISVSVGVFLSHSPSVFERLFHLSSCRKVVDRAADQRKNPQGQQGPGASSRCVTSLLAP